MEKPAYHVRNPVSGGVLMHHVRSCVENRATGSHVINPVTRLSRVDTPASECVERNVLLNAVCATKTKSPRFSSAARMKKTQGKKIKLVIT